MYSLYWFHGVVVQKVDSRLLISILMYVFIFLSLLVHLVPYAQGVTCVFIVVALVLFGWGELKYWCISMLVISLWQLSHFDVQTQVSDFVGFSIFLHWACTETHSVCAHSSWTVATLAQGQMDEDVITHHVCVRKTVSQLFLCTILRGRLM